MLERALQTSTHVDMRNPKMLLSIAAISPLLVGVVGGPDDVHRENGVVVRDLGDNRSGTPTFRAATIASVDLYTLVAVLADVERYETWMPRVAESHKVGDRGDRVYLRTKGSGLVRDREVVLAVSVQPIDGTSVRLRFRDVAFQHGDDMAVRMESLDGYYQLEARDDGTTRVVYRVAADPGGVALNALVEARLVQRIVDTLVALREHSVQSRPKYRAAAARWRARHEDWMQARLAAR